MRQENAMKSAEYMACLRRGKDFIEETEEEQKEGDMLAGRLDRV